MNTNGYIGIFGVLFSC